LIIFNLLGAKAPFLEVFMSFFGDIAKIGLSMIPGVGSYLGAHEANETNKDISSAQTAFQKNMSDTAHQREVEDLRKAGLNPILSANSGASTPTGASIPMQNELADSGKLASSVMDVIRMRKDLEQQTAAIDLAKAQKFANEKSAESAIASAKKANSETFATDLSNIQSSKELQSLLKHGTLDAEAKARTNAAQADSMDDKFRSDHNTLDNILKRVLPWLGGANSASQTYKNLRTPPTTNFKFKPR